VAELGEELSSEMGENATVRLTTTIIIIIIILAN
jgi:hypothetical protein